MLILQVHLPADLLLSLPALKIRDLMIYVFFVKFKNLTFVLLGYLWMLVQAIGQEQDMDLDLLDVNLP